MDADALLSIGKLLLSQPDLLKGLTNHTSDEGGSSFLEEFLHADDDEVVSAQIKDSQIEDSHKHDHRALLLALKPYLGKERRAGLELLLKISPILELLSK